MDATTAPFVISTVPDVAPSPAASRMSPPRPAPAIDDMVTRIVGYPAGDSHHAMAVQILQDHYNAVLAANRNTATTALRSTFALACESPTAVSFGL